jgi:GNAT superfamily N-acetyltransferase
MIRPAEISDFNAISNIKRSLALEIDRVNDYKYKINIQRKGFLIPSDYTQEEHVVDINKIFLVYEEEGLVKGYIRIDEKQELDQNADVYWFKPEIKKIYFSPLHANIGGIAILADTRRKGIASKLIARSIEEVKKKNINYLFSFVTLSPFINIPSIILHEKSGFDRIAVSKPHKLFGMDGYQSFLFGKNI